MTPRCRRLEIELFLKIANSLPIDVPDILKQTSIMFAQKILQINFVKSLAKIFKGCLPKLFRKERNLKLMEIRLQNHRIEILPKIIMITKHHVCLKREYYEKGKYCFETE